MPFGTKLGGIAPILKKISSGQGEKQEDWNYRVQAKVHEWSLAFTGGSRVQFIKTATMQGCKMPLSRFTAQNGVNVIQNSPA